MLRIVSHETERARRRDDRQRTGQPLKRLRLVEPIKRLITTSEGAASIADKVELDVNEGREAVPTLYEALYRRLASDTLPRTIDLNLIASAQAVFLERFEGGEVHFGHLAKGTPATVSIKNYSTGFEWTREQEMFDELWRIEEYNRSVGEAYNALLNHLHFGPLLAFTYTGANVTAADATAGASLLDRTRTTLVNALRTSTTQKRPGSVLVAASTDRFQIEDAIARRYDNVGNQLPELPIDTVVYYDGWTVSVGPKTYTYGGVASKTAYLVQPERKLRELVRTENGQDLIVERGDGDVSRRIVEQMAAHTYRTVYADVAGSTQQITLP